MKDERILMNAATVYLETLLGARATQGAWAGASQLPAYLDMQYRCVMFDLEGMDFLLIEPLGAIPGPATLEKQLVAMKYRFKGPVAVVLPSIDPVTRSRLLARRIPFIVPDQQLYFPELGLVLRERYSPAAFKGEEVQPAAQYLVVMLLMGLVPEDATVSDIARATGYSAMTATRILNALEDAGVVTCTKEGRTRRIIAPEARQGLWERAKPHLASPVQRILYLVDPEPPERYLEAGCLALSRMSNLAEPSRCDYAIDAAAAGKLLKAGLLVDTDSGEDTEARVQVWSYKPLPAPDGAWVNPFSLWLSLESDEDERVRKELDSLLEAQWLRE
jgi:DNA-binding transcriptional ArsR family regulator